MWYTTQGFIVFIKLYISVQRFIAEKCMLHTFLIISENHLGTA